MVPFGYFFGDQSLAMMYSNTDKYWLGLDLHRPEVQQIFRELAAKSDIVEDNFRPAYRKNGT
jgi:crotonobetainyl-CoA:carnitine CoA-transferase CaiB-like acyl-CoA transferase